jgi:hypothetical protein
MDYSMPERRKSKTDKRAKARYNRYKKGGSQRVISRDNSKKEKYS